MVLLYPEFLAIYVLEEVELTGAKKNILFKVCKNNHSGDLEELVAKVIQEFQYSTTKMVHSLE